MKAHNRSALLMKVFAFILLALLFSTGNSLSQPSIRFGVEGNPWAVMFPKVQLTFSVSCPNRRIDFKKENFILKDNGQIINDYQLHKACYSYAIVIDRSTNITASRLAQAKTVAKAIVDIFDTSCAAAIMVMSFSDTLTVNAMPTKNKNTLKSAIDGIVLSGNQKLWDNLYTAIIKSIQNQCGPMILFSDGFDSGSTLYNLLDCTDLAYQDGYQISTVGFSTPLNILTLDSIADRTAGTFYNSPQICIDWTSLFNFPHLTIDGVDYQITYNAPMCPETYKHIIEITAGLPSPLYCCQGTATKTIDYVARYRSEKINLRLDTVTVLAKQRGTVHLMLDDSIDGEFIRSTFKMRYDTSLCKFIDISTSGGLLQGKVISFQRLGDSLFFTVNENTCIKGKGLLASLTFEAKDSPNDVDCILELVDWKFAHGRFTASTGDGLFRILSHWLNLSSPLGGESYCVGDNVNIDWTQSRADTVNIDLSHDGGKNYSPLASNVSSSPFVWTIPNNQYGGMTYRIRVRDRDGELIDTSKDNFTINIPPRITLQPQNGTVCEGSDVNFYVYAVSYPLPQVQWERTTDKGMTWEELAGENDVTLKLVNVQRSSLHESKYRARFTNVCGMVTGDEAVLNINSLPVVATHPYDTTICEGTSLYLSSFASGFPAPKSQWQIAPEKGTTWTDITGETGVALTLTNMKYDVIHYQYRNVFTNDCGVAVSNAALIKVIDPLSITSQPQPNTQTVCTGQKISFSVQATGSNVKYQWLHNGNILSGENTAKLTIDSCTMNDDGYYVASVTGDCSNGIASDSVFVTVNHPATVTSQPKNQTVCQGTDAVFRVANISRPQASIQWQVSGDNGKTFTDVIGETHDSLMIKNVQQNINGNQYRAVLNNSCGTVTTQSALLQVNSGSPTITIQPMGLYRCEGTAATFDVMSYDATAYQWRKNGVNIPGETAPAFTINSVKSNDEGMYDVIVLNTCGQIISASANLSMKFPVRILSHPVSQTIKENSNVTFRSSVAGTNPTFQWLKNGNPISNATDSAYSIQSVKKSDEGDYSVRVFGACGNPVTSNIAKLLVTVVSDIDHGIVPAETRLYQNYPNPFSERTEIRYNLSASDHVILQVFDLLGRLITTLVDEHQNAGQHTVEFDLRSKAVKGVPSLQTGMYVYRLTIKNKSYTQTLTVIR